MLARLYVFIFGQGNVFVLDWMIWLILVGILL